MVRRFGPHHLLPITKYFWLAASDLVFLMQYVFFEVHVKSMVNGND